jgi:hypothetical protein
MLNGEEIQSNLREFVAKWETYTGTERSEAQTYLNELFACFGSDRSTCGAVFEDSKPADGIMDLYWEGLCIIEMKAPGEKSRLSGHRKQAIDYWASSADRSAHRDQPPFVVLCSFNRFEVFEPGRNMREPLAAFDLVDLPDHFEALNFLAGRGVMPLFGEFYRDLTTEAAKAVADLYHSVRDRDGAPPEEVQRFVLQLAWCLFAEDLGMLSGHPVQRIIEKLIGDPNTSSYAEFGALFDVLNDPGDYGRKGILAGTTYVNGTLFEKAARVHLEPTELILLRTAAEFDWRAVDPTIFGSLMEGCLGRELRWKLGAHYTYEADIMKIVGPTIVRPWRARIDAETDPNALLTMLTELCAFKVLDPACGCGNFLYVAYRELRAIEFDLKQRIAERAKATGLAAPDTTGIYYPLTNLQGIEIEPIVAQIARITLWMGHKQVSDKYGPAENVLPLVPLSSIVTGDALRLDWPKTDAIIGNPPFLGAKLVRSALGDDYADWLSEQFGVGVKDLCVYWFRKTQDHLLPQQRAGLVGTNSVSQTSTKRASLDYVLARGGTIADAVSSQVWPGDAHVHVSIVNWVFGTLAPQEAVILDGLPVSSIRASLRSSERDVEALRLQANVGRAFAGVVPQGKGFLLEPEDAKALIESEPAARNTVIRPFLTGDDIAQAADQQPRRYVIDFADMPLEAAMRWPKTLEHLRSTVKVERAESKNRAVEERWWLFGRRVPDMRAATANLRRFPAVAGTAKRLLIAWQYPPTLPNNACYVFAFDDDFSMGILLSHAHEAWAWAVSSTLETRLRYTNTSVFERFPWPDPVTDTQREAVADACIALLDRRSEICTNEAIGLTTLNNRLDEGAYTDLKALHKALDEAVAAAYDWPKSIAQDTDEVVRRLAALNAEIAAGSRPYAPFPDVARPDGQLSLVEDLTET